MHACMAGGGGCMGTCWGAFGSGFESAMFGHGECETCHTQVCSNCVLPLENPVTAQGTPWVGGGGGRRCHPPIWHMPCYDNAVFTHVTLIPFQVMSNQARHPRNPLVWEPIAAKVPKEFPFGMQRDNAKPGATEGSKEFSGFKSAADAVAFHQW